MPDAIMERMASVESREDQLAMGIEIARESVARVRDRVAGIQVSAPFGKIANGAGGDRVESRSAVAWPQWRATLPSWPEWTRPR